MPYEHTSLTQGQARRATIASALDSPETESFTVTPRGRDGKDDRTAKFDITAKTVEEAANIAAKRLYGRAVHARRTTGDARKSGYFQAYEDASDSGGWKVSSVGSSFHVG